jgi:hypothetical protein
MAPLTESNQILEQTRRLATAQQSPKAHPRRHHCIILGYRNDVKAGAVLLRQAPSETSRQVVERWAAPDSLLQELRNLEV